MRFMGSVGLENTALQSDGQSIRSSNWQPATGHNGKLEIWLPFAAPQSIALDWDNSIGPIRPIRPRTDLHPVDPTSRLHIICVERAPSNMCIFVYVKIYGSHNGFSLHLHLHNTCDGMGHGRYWCSCSAPHTWSARPPGLDPKNSLSNWTFLSRRRRRRSKSAGVGPVCFGPAQSSQTPRHAWTAEHLHVHLLLLLHLLRLLLNSPFWLPWAAKNELFYICRDRCKYFA